MKKLLAIIPLLVALSGQAQTNTPATNAPSISGGFGIIFDTIAHDTNIWWEAHGLYGAGLDHKAGGGIGMVYNINQYTFANIRLELVNGDLYMPQFTGGFGVPITLFGGVIAKPFVLGGVGVPLGGATIGTFKVPGNSGNPQAITGAGLEIKFSSTSKWAIIGDAETWYPMSVKPIYRLGVAFKF